MTLIIWLLVVSGTTAPLYSFSHNHGSVQWKMAGYLKGNDPVGDIYFHFLHWFPRCHGRISTFSCLCAGWPIWLLVGLFKFEGLPHHPHHTVGEGGTFGPHLPLRDGLPTIDLFYSSYLEVTVLGPHVVGAHHLCLLVLLNTSRF